MYLTVVCCCCYTTSAPTTEREKAMVNNMQITNYVNYHNQLPSYLSCGFYCQSLMRALPLYIYFIAALHIYTLCLLCLYDYYALAMFLCIYMYV